jgi:hypothetical protein
MRAMMPEVVQSVLAENAVNKILDPAVVTPSVIGATGISLPLDSIVAGSMFQTGMPPIAPLSASIPRHILLRWLWVDVETVNLRQLGRFEIESLPKLHQTDESRNAYIKKSVQGFLQPLDGGPSEVLIGTTRLQASFKKSNTFYLAWDVYMSIHTAFHSDRASGLALWTSCLHFFELLNYPWSGILKYIIAYYKLNQNACQTPGSIQTQS